MLVVGLKPLHKYLVETDDEELREAETDRVGTLVLPIAADRSAGVRISESNQIRSEPWSKRNGIGFAGACRKAVNCCAKP